MEQKTLKYKQFYIPYIPKADINYIYLLSLYKIMEEADDRGIKQDIGYSSIKELLSRINRDKTIMSESTLRRLLKNKEYNDFFSIEKYGSMNWIHLNNDFRKSEEKTQPFVVLCPNTYNLLIQEQDNLLAKYTIYMKYMCGYCGGSTDFTANQFLSTIGYSNKSHSLKDTLSKYNILLEKNGLISIKRTPLEEGKRRNTYTFTDK